MTFWIITAALTLAVAAILARAALHGRDTGEPPAAYDLRVYRDQLKEIERDAARGIIATDEAERMRAEVARRILAADAYLQSSAAAPAAKGPVTAMIVLSALVLVGGAFALYTRLGAYDGETLQPYGDLALKDRLAKAEEVRRTRPAQAEAEAQTPPLDLPAADANFLTLMERLRDAVTKRPDDLQGHVLLARNEAALGNFKAAYAAQSRILAIKGDAATAQDYADYADLLILAAGGYVSPEAEAALAAALTRDEKNGPARYYYALMLSQTGRPDRAFRIWETQLKDGPANAPWIAPIRQQIEEMAFRAGVRFTLPPEAPMQGLPGPTGEDKQNAAQMSEADRQQMIRGMVERLSDRLATEGGTPEEWARLIGALGVLGDTERATAILAEARTKFATQPAALETVNAAARQAGLVE